MVLVLIWWAVLLPHDVWRASMCSNWSFVAVLVKFWPDLAPKLSKCNANCQNLCYFILKACFWFETAHQSIAGLDLESISGGMSFSQYEFGTKPVAVGVLWLNSALLFDNPSRCKITLHQKLAVWYPSTYHGVTLCDLAVFWVQHHNQYNQNTHCVLFLTFCVTEFSLCVIEWYTGHVCTIYPPTDPLMARITSMATHFCFGLAKRWDMVQYYGPEAVSHLKK